MAKRRIVVLQNDQEWIDYLLEAFDDTPSTPEAAKSPQEALDLVRRGNPDVVFASPGLLTKPVTAALQAHRASNADFRVFSLGKTEGPSAYPFDGVFEGMSESIRDFEKKLAPHLPLPAQIHLLVVDDQPGIGEMFRDYFDHRTDPQFIVETALNGLEAEKKIEKQFPDVMVLDIKMPEKDGRELFRELKQKGKLPPTIVFCDLIASEEILYFRKWGNPAFIEKGAHTSTPPALAALIKKIAYFG